MSSLNWRKSSRCAADSPQCVEIAHDGKVMIRDSKNPDGRILGVSARNFAKFVNALGR